EIQYVPARPDDPELAALRVDLIDIHSQRRPKLSQNRGKTDKVGNKRHNASQKPSYLCFQFRSSFNFSFPFDQRFEILKTPAIIDNTRSMSGTVTAVSMQTFESTVDSHPIVILDFWAAWCGPCKIMAPIFEDAAKRHSDVFFGKVNTEDEK